MLLLWIASLSCKKSGNDGFQSVGRGNGLCVVANLPSPLDLLERRIQMGSNLHRCHAGRTPAQSRMIGRATRFAVPAVLARIDMWH